MEQKRAGIKPAAKFTRQRMRRVTIKLTIKELELLTSLVSDQAFRREYIESKMPGYRINPDEIGLSKVIIQRLQASIKSGLLSQRHPVRMAG